MTVLPNIKSGQIISKSGIVVSYIPQRLSFFGNTIREHINMCDANETLAFTILAKLGVYKDEFSKELLNLSLGQQKKIHLAISLAKSSHLYIWDEPLNYIDIFSRMQIETLIKEFMPTMIFIDHDKAFCDNISTKILQL